MERNFDYAEQNFLAGRTFKDWLDLNEQARRWSKEVANQKVKRSLGMSPEAACLMEKPHLTPFRPISPLSIRLFIEPSTWKAMGVRQIHGYNFTPWPDIPGSLPTGH